MGSVDEMSWTLTLPDELADTYATSGGADIVLKVGIMGELAYMVEARAGGSLPAAALREIELGLYGLDRGE